MKKKPRAKKDELGELLGTIPGGQDLQEVKLAFAKFGAELSPEQEARLKEILEKKENA
jgi:hypothetical protein